MKRTLVLIVAITAGFVVPTVASQDITMGQLMSKKWVAAKKDDPLHGKTMERVALLGDFITPPRRPNLGPTLEVDCSAGKIDGVYVEADAVVDTPRLEVRIDDGKQTRIFGSESTDHESVFFSRSELFNMLWGHKVIIGVNEFMGTEIVMQFMMPDPTPIIAACGNDTALKAAAAAHAKKKGADW